MTKGTEVFCGVVIMVGTYTWLLFGWQWIFRRARTQDKKRGYLELRGKSRLRQKIR